MTSSCYTRIPADGTEPEEFPLTFTGLTDKKTGVLARALYCSVGGPAQLVTVTRTGQPVKPLREYRSGRETLRSRAGKLPDPDRWLTASRRTRRKTTPVRHLHADPVSPPCETSA